MTILWQKHLLQLQKNHRFPPTCLSRQCRCHPEYESHGVAARVVVTAMKTRSNACPLRSSPSSRDTSTFWRPVRPARVVPCAVSLHCVAGLQLSATTRQLGPPRRSSPTRAADRLYRKRGSDSQQRSPSSHTSKSASMSSFRRSGLLSVAHMFVLTVRRYLFLD